MEPGFVYILTNASTPGLVKIGRSTRSPLSRAQELSQATGVAAPFVVAWAAEVADCERVERLVHQQLDGFRFNRNREFFSIPLEGAIQVLSQIAQAYPVDCVRLADQPDPEALLPMLEWEARQPPPAPAPTSDDVLTRVLTDAKECRRIGDHWW